MKLLALIKKEFHRFFHDPRLIITVILPGIIIFALYNVLGTVVHESDIGEGETYEYRLLVTGESFVTETIAAAVKESGSTLKIELAESEEAGKAAVEEGGASLYMKFSQNFDECFIGGTATGEVEIWYNDLDEQGAVLYQISAAVLESVGMRFTILPHSVASEDDFGKMLMASLLPFLVVTFVFSACMSVTLESIAGEKERGTLSTILATSVPRSHIALGKIVPLSAISALGAASSFLGVLLSMPKLMGTSLSAFGGYGLFSYLALFLLIVSFVPLIVGAIATVSTLSKSVKEASAYTSFIMVLLMVLSLTSTFLSLGNWIVGVPVFNAVFIMGKILGGEVLVWQTLLSVGFNLLYTVLLVLLVSKLLSSERVMFGK